MTTKEIYELIESKKIEELYKKFIDCFQWIDNWADKLLKGDILTEFELSFMLDKSTGIYSKLCPIVNALESYYERVENNSESLYYKKLENIRTQDTSVAKANARAEVSNIRDYIADFKSYLLASQQNITTAQSRLKRLTVEKGSGYRGEVPVKEDEPIWS